MLSYFGTIVSTDWHAYQIQQIKQIKLNISKIAIKISKLIGEFQYDADSVQVLNCHPSKFVARNYNWIQSGIFIICVHNRHYYHYY